MGTGWRRPAPLPGSGRGTLCSYFARAPWWPWGGPRPGHTKSCSLLGCQGCGSRPRAAHSSCWYLITRIWARWVQWGCSEEGEPGDTQGSHWACREPLVLAHLADHRERGVLVRFYLWPCPSRLCRSGTGALGEGWSQFPGVEDAVGPALALRVCAAWPPVSSRPWVWTWEGRVCPARRSPFPCWSLSPQPCRHGLGDDPQLSPQQRCDWRPQSL